MATWFVWGTVSSAVLGIAALVGCDLWRTNQPNRQARRAQNSALISGSTNPAATPAIARIIEHGWHADGQHHYSYERKYWIWTLWLTATIAIGAGISAWYSHDTAVQARIANQMNAESSRAWMSGPELVEGGFAFTNIGKNPTNGLYIDMEPLSGSKDGFTIAAAICNRIKPDFLTGGLEFSAIPGAKWQVDFAQVPHHHMPADFLLEQPGIKWIVGCVVYKIQSDTKIHQTGFQAAISTESGSPRLKYSYTNNAD